MTDPDEIVEICAFIAEHADTIPPHRRRQALLALERAERLIPPHDDEVDDLEASE